MSTFTVMMDVNRLVSNLEAYVLIPNRPQDSVPDKLGLDPLVTGLAGNLIS
jgi:hypothetical protein